MTAYTILVTGWRDWPEEHAHAVQSALSYATQDLDGGDRVVVRHGQCPFGGVDLWADRWAQDRGWFVSVDPHPAEYDARGKLLGPQRNTKMVNLGADLCLAFPGPGSRGTIDCYTKAIAAGIRSVSLSWPCPCLLRPPSRLRFYG